jgi:hypothetical protein
MLFVELSDNATVFLSYWHQIARMGARPRTGAPASHEGSLGELSSFLLQLPIEAAEELHAIQ